MSGNTAETLNTATLKPEKQTLTGKKVFGIQASVLYETLLFLGVIILLSYIFGEGDRFINASPHPFWLPVLLIIMQYGTIAGLVCATLSTFALLFFNIPVIQFDENIYEYFLRLTYQPTLWFIAAVFLGELRMRHIHERNDLVDQLADAEEKERTIAHSYRRLKDIKEGMETHMATQFHSSISTFRAMKSIESLNPIEILHGIGEAITEIMGPDKFSVYAFGDNGFEIVSSHGWQDEDPFESRIMEDQPMYHEMVGKKRILTSINEFDAKLLNNQGILAGPLIDPQTDEIFGMVKIEQLDLKSLSLRNIEIFSILCQSAGIAYTQSLQYQKMQKYSLKDLKTGLLSHSFFQHQKTFCQSLATKFDVGFFMINVQLTNKKDFSKKDKETIGKEMSKLCRNAIGKEVDLFSDRKSDSDFIILLPSKNVQKTDFVISKLHDAISTTKNKALQNAVIAFKAKPLF